MGTSVATGTAQAIVFATAMNTELGQIARFRIVEARRRRKNSFREKT